jgi:hypothetical protein
MSRAAISSPLSPGGVSHKPAGAPSPSAPAGCIAQTLDALRLDLETHRTRAADCAALIDRLSAYTAASGTAPPQPSPPVAAKLSDADDERRARQRESMRRYRASKAAAKPKAKKQPRKHPGKKAASVVQPRLMPSAIRRPSRRRRPIRRLPRMSPRRRRPLLFRRLTRRSARKPPHAICVAKSSAPHGSATRSPIGTRAPSGINRRRRSPRGSLMRTAVSLASAGPQARRRFCATRRCRHEIKT